VYASTSFQTLMMQSIHNTIFCTCQHRQRQLNESKKHVHNQQHNGDKSHTYTHANCCLQQCKTAAARSIKEIYQ
jgi:hypothetical protein